MTRWLIMAWIASTLTITGSGVISQPVETINIQGKDFSVDLMGNVYWTDNQTLIKYQPETDEKYEYSDNFLGPVHSYDISNPLRILIFHKALNQIVFLDKTLSAIGSAINLDELGLTNPVACCTSHKGGFWVLNSTTKQLQHYDQNLQLIQESPLIPEFENLQDTKPRIIEKNRQLYCHLPDCCTLIFDRFGNPIQRYPLKNVDNIQMLNGNIYYFYEDTLNKISGGDLEPESIPLPKGGKYWDDAKMGGQNKLYLLKGEKLYIYRHKF